MGMGNQTAGLLDAEALYAMTPAFVPAASSQRHSWWQLSGWSYVGARLDIPS